MKYLVVLMFSPLYLFAQFDTELEFFNLLVSESCQGEEPIKLEGYFSDDNLTPIPVGGYYEIESCIIEPCAEAIYYNDIDGHFYFDTNAPEDSYLISYIVGTGPFAKKYISQFDLQAANAQIIVLDSSVCNNNITYIQPNPRGGILSGSGIESDSLNEEITYFFNPKGLSTDTTYTLTYEYSITANSGLVCTDVSYTSITVFDSLNVNIIPDSIFVCIDELLHLEAELTGDTSEVKIEWYNPEFSIISADKEFSTDTITTSGDYYVFVINKNGCSDLESIHITVNPPPSISCGVSNNVSCHGVSDGEGNVTLDDSYSYTWSDGGLTPIRSGLSSGIYVVTVTDHNSCTASCSLSIQEPEPLAIDCRTNITHPSCHDAANGKTKIAIHGGTPPYSISQNNLDYIQTDSLMFLSPGDQIVYVLDSHGCKEQCEFKLENPEKTECRIHVDNHISCHNNSDAQLSVFSSEDIFEVEWNTGHTTRSIENLSAGIYIATTTSSQGCISSCTLTLTEPDPLLVQIRSYSHPVCNGDSNGNIELNSTGGSPPYAYSLNGSTPQASSQFYNLPSGIYIIQVLDQNLCAVSTAQVLIDPLKLEGKLFQQDEILCNGDHTGSLTVEYSEEFSEVEWSTGSYDDKISGLRADQYSVTLTTDEGCSLVLEEEIVEPLPLSLDSYTIDNIDCHGESTGKVAITVSGGVPPYNYLWSNGETNITNTSLRAGSYKLTITDSNNCQLISDSLIISENEAWSISTEPIISCLDEKINLQINVHGQNPDDLSYLWFVDDNIVGATDDLLIESAGRFIVFDSHCLPEGVVDIGCIVTDTYGCTEEVSISITLASCFDLAIRKTVVGDISKERDEPAVFNITVFNQGSITAYDLTIQDFPDQELLFIEEKNRSKITGNPYSWLDNNGLLTTRIDSIEAQSAVTLKIYFQISSDTEKRNLYNEAEIIDYNSRYKKLPFDQDDLLSDNPIEKDDDIDDDSMGTIDNPDDDDQRDGAYINLCPNYQHQVLANLCGRPDPMLLMTETIIAQLDPEGDGDGDDSDGDRGNKIVSFHEDAVSAFLGDTTLAMTLEYSDEIYARLLTKEACVTTIPLQLEFYLDPELPDMQEEIFASLGEDVLLSIDEQPAYNYQWQIEHNNNYQDIPAATENTLLIKAVTASHNNLRYRVVLSHATAPVSCSSVSASTTFRIMPDILVCNDKLNTSLNEDCSINLSASQLLQNNNLPDSLFNLVYLDEAGQLITQEDYVLYTGEEIQYVVTNKINNVSCWGNLYLSDNTPPTISCPGDTLSLPCHAMDNLMYGLDINHSDNCSASKLVIEESDLETICSLENSVNYTGNKKIKLYALDEAGNKSLDCNILVLYQSAVIDHFVFPSNLILDYDSWDTNNNGYPDPEETGTILDQDSIAISSDLENRCNLKLHYEDSIFPLCGESYIILRKWTLVDWCSQQIINRNQLIRVDDILGPELQSARIDTVLNINKNSCLASFRPKAKHLVDPNSSSYFLVSHFRKFESDTTYTFRASYPQDSIPILQLEEGAHRIDIQYHDDCDVHSTGSFYVKVEAQIPLSAVCKSLINVQLNDGGKVELKAEQIDNHTLSFCDLPLYYGLRSLPETVASTTQSSIYNIESVEYYESIVIDSSTEILELVVFNEYQHSVCRTKISKDQLGQRNRRSSTKVYPNPFTNELIVTVESDSDQEIMINLYSMTGQNMYVEKHAIKSGIQTLTLKDEFLQLASGNYMLVIKGKDLLYSSPIVKVK